MDKHITSIERNGVAALMNVSRGFAPTVHVPICMRWSASWEELGASSWRCALKWVDFLLGLEDNVRGSIVDCEVHLMARMSSLECDVACHGITVPLACTVVGTHVSSSLNSISGLVFGITPGFRRYQS